MRARNQGIMGLALASVLAVPLLAAEPERMTWTFDQDKVGAIAPGFTNEVGRWTVVGLEQGQALAQSAQSPEAVYNIALIDQQPKAKNVVLTVRFQAVAGKIDQGGGLVWRAKDAKNYYVARYNPLEDNYRLYTVVNGTRTQIASADIPRSDGWHALRVTMKGDQIRCAYDGKTALEARDATFPEAGRIGLWTKADAQTRFDDLTLAAP